MKKFNVTLKPDKPKHPDYSDIITKAQSLLAKEFDVVFCLIDMDYINADNVRKQAYDKEKSSCIKAYKNEIYFIESNPAFEFWLLLHFVFTDRQFRNCDEVITELKKNGRLEDVYKRQQCDLFLEFRYDYNMVNEDWFADQVEEVKVYVFDAEGKYLQTFIEKGNPLKNTDYRMLIPLSLIHI